MVTLFLDSDVAVEMSVSAFVVEDSPSCMVALSRGGSFIILLSGDKVLLLCRI
jgi:hypothetical protein